MLACPHNAHTSEITDLRCVSRYWVQEEALLHEKCTKLPEALSEASAELSHILLACRPQLRPVNGSALAGSSVVGCLELAASMLQTTPESDSASQESKSYKTALSPEKQPWNTFTYTTWLMENYQPMLRQSQHTDIHISHK